MHRHQPPNTRTDTEWSQSVSSVFFRGNRLATCRPAHALDEGAATRLGGLVSRIWIVLQPRNTRKDTEWSQSASLRVLPWQSIVADRRLGCSRKDAFVTVEE